MINKGVEVNANCFGSLQHDVLSNTRHYFQGRNSHAFRIFRQNPLMFYKQNILQKLEFAEILHYFILLLFSTQRKMHE